MVSRERAQSLMDQPSAVSLMMHQHSTEREDAPLCTCCCCSLPWLPEHCSHTAFRETHTMEWIYCVLVYPKSFRYIFFLFNAKLVQQDGPLGEAKGLFSVCRDWFTHGIILATSWAFIPPWSCAKLLKAVRGRETGQGGKACERNLWWLAQNTGNISCTISFLVPAYV